jgi:prepilin-type N-terminal cleavage/methylation domain-containing protein
MFFRNIHKRSDGFTLVELVVSISLIGTMLVIFSLFFTSNYQGYLNLQLGTMRLTEVSNGLQRTARVLRGINIITDAQPKTITGFAYFTPRDETLSKVRYFYDESQRKLRVGVIPATGTAPNYTYNPADEQLTTIADNINSSQPIFSYLNVSGEPATFTASNYKDIYGIGITLTADTIDKTAEPQQFKTSVSLRNRKINL